MVQAARSGVQNIAEGSQASGTSKKTELKLTNVARASLEELKLDYEDYLRQHDLQLWSKDEPLRKQLVAQRCTTATEVAHWITSIRNQYITNMKSSKSITSIGKAKNSNGNQIIICILDTFTNKRHILLQKDGGIL